MTPLREDELERVQEAVAANLGLPRTEFVDRLCSRCLERHPAVLAWEEAQPELEEGQPPPPRPPWRSWAGRTRW